MDVKRFIWAVINLIVFGLIFYVLWWGLGQLNPPAPFMKVGQAILVIGAVIVVINFLLSLVGKEFITWDSRNPPSQ